MSDQTETTEAPETAQAEEGDYALDRKDITAILYAVDIDDRDQLLALMEHHFGADSSKTANDDSFLQALDCLSRSQTRLLEEGILAAKSLMQTIMEQVRASV